MFRLRTPPRVALKARKKIVREREKEEPRQLRERTCKARMKALSVRLRDYQNAGQTQRLM